MTTIRWAESADQSVLDAVAELEARVFGDASWSLASLQREFDGIGQTRSIVVAAEQEQLVGYGVLMYAAESSDIHRIAVDQGHRRRGLGRRLVDELLTSAQRRGCCQALLEVAADNAPGLALYAGRGFAPMSKRLRYYPGDVDAIVMRRLLGPAMPVDAGGPGT